jgi:hypothetical protein
MLRRFTGRMSEVSSNSCSMSALACWHQQRSGWELGEHLSAIETKLCAPMQWLQSNAGIWALLGRRFVFGQDASQIQRQQLLKLSHNEDFAFGICFLIECHHASDYLERCLCSK